MRIREHFNPRAPCGARPSSAKYPLSHSEFQPTRPLRGATSSRSTLARSRRNFNPRAPCGARRLHFRLAEGAIMDFNPRAPCGARLQASADGKEADDDFNPRAPCGARPWTAAREHWGSIFQSTRSLRGATAGLDRVTPTPYHFNPRAPCGARQRPRTFERTRKNFNPRAPCGARRAGRRR